MSDKHTELENQCKKLQKELKIRERQTESLIKEKEALQRELNKTILVQEKLKDVCREQQKLIKSVGNESVQQIQQEEDRRKENQDKFQKSLNEINGMIAKNNEENLKLRNENIEMSQQLIRLTEQCEAREQQMKQIEEKIKIDTQLHQARLEKLQIEFALEKEIIIQQKEIATNKLLDTETILKDFRDRERGLKEQIQLYSSKYEAFQSSIQKSNKMFEKYKREIETMSRNTRKLENELFEWKKKYEKCNATLINLATERNEKNIAAAKSAKQMEQLQKLLRTLQVERTALYKILAEHNIECPKVQHIVPEQAINTHLVRKNKGDKLDAMVKNCSELKEALASVQEKMKEIGAEQNANKPIIIQDKENDKVEETVLSNQNSAGIIDNISLICDK